MLLNEVFNVGPKLYPNKVAIIEEKRRFTYREAGERHNRLANALISLGMKKGDHLGLVLKNCAEFFEAYAAAAKAGFVVGGVNYRLAPEGIKKMIEDIGCRVLLVDYEFIDTINSLRAQLPFLKTCVSIGGKDADMLEYESLLQEASTIELDVVHEPNDPANIIYTSGTTGLPKGALATRAIAMNRICNTVIELTFHPDDRYLQILPVFHVGIYVALGVIFRGGTLVIMRDWSEKDFCRTVQKENINKTCIAPVMLNSVTNWSDVTQYDLNSLRLVLYGAAPMPEATIKRGVKLLPNCKHIQAYGSSEAFTVVYLRPEEHAVSLGGRVDSEERKGSCGRQGALGMAKVVDVNGTEVKPGEVGEVLLGGGTIMSEYLSKPEETEEALKDGWFYTNDLATVDEEGFISIVDRKNFMIITGGENVFPAQVENVLFSHPKVAEAAVFGVPDEKWGEVVKSLVVLKPGETATQEELIDFCRPKMANYAKPKSIDFLEALPYTNTGKIDRMLLRQRYSGK